MIPPVDVIVTFYRRHEFWPMLLRGLEANKDYISRVIVVNDGPWSSPADMIPETTIPTAFLDFPDHNGMGISRAMNYGASFVKTPFFIHIDDDAIPLPGSFEKLLAFGTRPKTFTSGYAVQGTLATFEQDFIQPCEVGGLKLGGKSPWLCVCGAFFVVDTKEFLSVRWNETMTGYGYQDYEFAARWLGKGNKLRMAPIKVLHLGLARAERDGDDQNREIFAQTLRTLGEMQ